MATHTKGKNNVKAHGPSTCIALLRWNPSSGTQTITESHGVISVVEGAGTGRYIVTLESPLPKGACVEVSHTDTDTTQFRKCRVDSASGNTVNISNRAVAWASIAGGSFPYSNNVGEILLTVYKRNGGV